MLEKGEEYMLAKRWLEHNDTASAHKMVTSHLRLVAKIASGYRGYGLPLAELIGRQYRVDASRKALRLEQGFGLATYAMWWIHVPLFRSTFCTPGHWLRSGRRLHKRNYSFNLRKLKGQIEAFERAISHQSMSMKSLSVSTLLKTKL